MASAASRISTSRRSSRSGSVGRPAPPPWGVLGRDPRRSGRMLESALAAGLCSVGMEVRLVGHVPTPGLAYLAKTDQFVAGAVISASHNPAPDNGIKFFDHRAQKLPDSVEDRIEALMTGDDTL